MKGSKSQAQIMPVNFDIAWALSPSPMEGELPVSPEAFRITVRTRVENIRCY